MTSPLHVVYVTSELAPPAQAGGLADVAASLPKAVASHGHRVDIFLPFYKGLQEADLSVEYTGKEVKTWLRGEEVRARIFRSNYFKLRLYLIEGGALFNREGIYGADGQDYPDNPLRFAFFNQAVLQAIKALGLHPDVIHLNDWVSSLIPLYKKWHHRDHPVICRTATLLTIHNLAYQGVFDKHLLPQLGLPWDEFHYASIEFHDQLNYLKGGIMAATVINTVSPSYAKEVLSPSGGFGLDAPLRDRASDFCGVLNGIDPDEWDPEMDPHLFRAFGSENLSGKRENKVKLQELLNLEADLEMPLISMIARRDRQKGYDLVAAVAGDLLRGGVQFALMGSGQQRYADIFNGARARWPKLLHICGEHDHSLARKILAGSDIFLMPSRYEPCGLTQLFSLRYGAVPVVRRTGGLADTITDYRETSEEGNGFVFDEVSPQELLAAIKRAIHVYRNKELWNKLVSKIMQLDFSWKSSALRYIELYRQAVSKATSSNGCSVVGNVRRTGRSEPEMKAAACKERYL